MLQVQVYAAVDGTGELKQVGILLWKEGEAIQPIPDIPLLRELIERPLVRPGGPISSADNPEAFMKGLCLAYSGTYFRVSRPCQRASPDTVSAQPDGAGMFGGQRALFTELP